MSDGQHEPREYRPTARVAGTAIAACFALAAFAVAILAGIASGNTAGSVLVRAFIAMIVCYPLGIVVALVCQRVLDDHLGALRQADPAPEADSVEASTSGEVSPLGEPAADDEEVLVV